jgi:hypothetical protein
MSFKHVLFGVALLFMLAITWRLAQSDWARGLHAPAAKPPARISFDNGTVRQYDSPASVAARSKGQPLPLGTLRKCQRAGDITYTNSFCPPGTRELALAKGTVNVLESGPVHTAPPAAKPSPAEPSLRERAIERAVHQ